MMEYSTETQALESDLASCNLENLLYIECTLENNISWSDGSKITPADILATFNIIKETKVNPIIASLLEDTTIEVSENTISFSMAKKDVNILYLFIQPILPERIVEDLNSENVNGKLSEIWAVYSGRFRLININQDETVGVTKLTLWKNENYFWNETYLEFLILNLYRDESHFLKNKNSFNIFNDSKYLIGGSIPRLEAYEYIISQFTTSFFNTENLSLNLRKYILDSLDRDAIIDSVWKANSLPVYNPFLTNENIDSEPDNDYNFEDAIAIQGYYSKKELLKNALEANQESNSWNVISGEAKPTKPEVSLPVQSDLSYIVSPTTKKYNFISEDNVLIEWRVDAWVESVFINDYELTGFSPGDSRFYYRLLESYDFIAPGENVYKIYFSKWGEKTFIEEFVYIYNSDSDELANIRDNYFQEPQETESSQQEENSQEDSSAWEALTNLSTAQIQALDDGFYYNAEGEPFTISLVYSQSDAEQELVANAMIAQIEAAWIKVEKKSMSLWDITAGLRAETLEYDMMLLGINLWFLEADIFPYFHSSQVQNGYNIANYKKLSLDILLEELKSNRLSQTKQEELTEKMLEIFRDEAIIYTLYTPKIELLIDRNIKNFSLPEYLPDSTFRYYPLTKSYLSEKKIISGENKNMWWFIRFVFSNLFSK